MIDDKEKIFNRVLEVVAGEMKIKEDDILSRSRKIEIVLPRNVLIFILRKYFGFSYPAIAKLVGLQHTTIINSYRNVVKMSFLSDYSDRLFREKSSIARD